MKQDSKQDVATEEQPTVASEESTEETTKETPEVTSTEEKATSERQRTEEEFRKLQGKMTKAINESKAYGESLKSAQGELQELRNEMERQRLDDQRRQLDSLADDPDAQKKLMAKFDLDKERREFDAHQKRERDGMLKAWNQAAELVKEHNLTPADAADLLDARTPKEMELMAKLKAAEQAKGQGKVQDTKEKEAEGFEPDSSRSDGGPSDFKTLEKNFINNPQKYALAYQKALAQRGQ